MIGNENAMKQYFDTQQNINEYEKTIRGLLEKFDFIRTEALAEGNPDIRKELTEAMVSGYSAVVNGMETMFGAELCAGIRSYMEHIEKLYNAGEYDTLLTDAGSMPEKCTIIVSAGCHRIMCEAAARVPEAEINAEIRTVLNMLGNEVVLSGKYDDDYPEETDYMRRHNKIYVFPYNFTDKYDASQIKVYYDGSKDLKYVIHNGKKLYFPAWNDDKVQIEYNQLILEQDPESPHRYFDDECCVSEGDIFVDVGAAEGIISLDVIERAGEVYLIECSENWIRTLKESFADYQDKVHIIPKYAGAFDDEETVTLDTLLEKYSERRIFIKMDIEGMEPDALMGARKTLARNNCRVSCAVYHTNDESTEVTGFFEKNGYRVYPSENYMLFLYCKSLFDNGKYERIRAPFFRNGVIRALKD